MEPWQVCEPARNTRLRASVVTGMARRRAEYRVRWHHPSWLAHAWNQRIFGTKDSAIRWQEKQESNGSKTVLEWRQCEPWQSLDSPQIEPAPIAPFQGKYPEPEWTLELVIRKLKLPANARFPSPRALASKLRMSRSMASAIKQAAITNGYVKEGKSHVLTTLFSHDQWASDQ